MHKTTDLFSNIPAGTWQAQHDLAVLRIEGATSARDGLLQTPIYKLTAKDGEALNEALKALDHWTNLLNEAREHLRS